MRRVGIGLLGLALAVTVGAAPVSAQDKFVMGYGAGT